MSPPADDIATKESVPFVAAAGAAAPAEALSGAATGWLAGRHLLIAAAILATRRYPARTPDAGAGRAPAQARMMP